MVFSIDGSGRTFAFQRLQARLSKDRLKRGHQRPSLFLQILETACLANLRLLFLPMQPKNMYAQCFFVVELW